MMSLLAVSPTLTAVLRLLHRASRAQGVALVARCEGGARVLCGTGADQQAAEALAAEVLAGQAHSGCAQGQVAGMQLCLATVRADQPCDDLLADALTAVTSELTAYGRSQDLMKDLLHDLGNSMGQLSLHVEVARHRSATVPASDLLREVSDLTRDIHATMSAQVRERLGGAVETR